MDNYDPLTDSLKDTKEYLDKFQKEFTQEDILQVLDDSFKEPYFKWETE